jgi:hypothetical protein
MFTLAEGYSDMEGEPLVAYYCNECAKEYLPPRVVPHWSETKGY